MCLAFAILANGLAMTALAKKPAATTTKDDASTHAPADSDGVVKGVAPPGPAVPARERTPEVIDSFAKLPLRFEANGGQVNPAARYVVRGGGYNLFLTPTESVFVLEHGARGKAGAKATKAAGAQPSVLRVRLVGSNARPEMTGLEELPGRSNYFIGNDPAKWRTDVVSYGKVKYEGVYPGVDVVYYGNQRRLEHDFVISPGADPRLVRMDFDGARKLSVNTDGDLVIKIKGGELRQARPVAYQESGGVRREVASRYVIAGRRQVAFELGEYDASLPLVIDPVLVYSTYLGGGNTDQINGAAVDSSGSAYVTGVTYSANFPTSTTPLYASISGTSDVFITKLDPSGTSLVYSTYLGGGDEDTATSIALNSSGNAFVTGSTYSSDFPTANPLQPNFASAPGTFSSDAFVVKLSANGSVLNYSTYFGGSGSDGAAAIALDSSENAYITGTVTPSTDFPTVNALQPSSAGSNDAYVAKLNPAGSALVYSTYLGGAAVDNAYDIAADSAGNAYITGRTRSTNFPTANAYQPSLTLNPNFGALYDAFVTKINPTGSALVYSTYLGGYDVDYGHAITVDSSGSAYVTGRTSSGNFPNLNAFRTAPAGYDAFVTKLSPSGTSLVYSTYLGGGGEDIGNDITLDASGSAYVTGSTYSADLATVNPVRATLGGTRDAFVSKISASGSSLVFFSYLGGGGEDYGTSVSVDSSADVYVAGITQSTDFPTASPVQASHGGGTCGSLPCPDGFVTKISGLATYSITGRLTDANNAGIGSATVALAGSQAATTQTDADGYYSFPNVGVGGNFTVTPTKSPYTFVPASRSFNNVVQNQTGDFTVLTYTVGGRLTDGSGNGVENAAVAVTGFQSASAFTDAGGYYTIGNLAAGGGYTVTPTKSDPFFVYTFAPASQSISALGGNTTTVNFTASTAASSTLWPTADAYVQDGTSAALNFGTAQTLKLQTDTKTNTGKNIDSYFRFDLSGVTPNITSAKLRVNASLSAAGSVGTSAYGVTNTTWAESGTSGITWNNKPARNAAAITGATATVNNVAYATYDIDVTSYVKGEKAAGRDIVSLALHNASASTVFINLKSREAADGQPQLVVTNGTSTNAAPTVSITAPANGASFTAGANINVSASAADADGTVGKVEFFSGTALIGTATASPYQITWANVAAGSYSLRAVVTDDKGASTTSANVGINVVPPNVAPAVSVTSPLGGAVFAATSNVGVSANASDADGSISKVEFFAGATLIGTATTPSAGGSYGVTWSNVQAGAYSLTAKATDNAGGVTTSAAVAVSVVGQTGLSPTADAYVRDGTSAATNFGTATELQTQSSATAGNNRESYLKFDLTTVNGIAKAKLRLYGRLSDTTGTNVPTAVYSVATTTWVESGTGSIAWNNKQPAGATPLASTTVTDNTARWYEWDVTSYLSSEKASGRNVVSLVVKDTAASSPYVTFNSKEAAANRPQLVVWATQPRNALLVVGSATLNAGDSAAKTRLENLGYTVTVKAAGSTTNTAVNTSDADGKALVVISSTVTPANVAAKFRNVPVPVVVWEFDLLDDQGMTGTVSGTDYGTTASQTQASIASPTHPMAAGLSGNVAVVTAAGALTWGKPNANAAKIATLTTDSTKAVIFGYDGGAAMPGLEAPARRVGLFLTDTTAGSLTAAGGSLFDAAVKWAGELVTSPTVTSLTPASGVAGVTVTVGGYNFGATKGSSTLAFNGVAATTTAWGDRSIVATVPAFATTGSVVVTVNGVASNGVTFAVGDSDVDADGLPDWWEVQYFGNLNQGAGGDPDGDGITNLLEYAQGRNPTKSALADAGDFVGLKVYTQLSPATP